MRNGFIWAQGTEGFDWLGITRETFEGLHHLDRDLRCSSLAACQKTFQKLYVKSETILKFKP